MEKGKEASPCDATGLKVFGKCEHTFDHSRSDWIRDAIDIVSPGTSFASSALVRAAISFISIEVRSCSAPTTMLDGEKDHLPFSRNLVAFVDGIGTSLVVSSNPWV